MLTLVISEITRCMANLRARTKTTGLGANLRKIREERGLTQTELGRISGVSPSLISLIESGRRNNPSMTTLRALEKGLGKPAVRLAYDMIMPDKADSSLSRFLESPLGKATELTPDEIADLKRCVWYGPYSEPDNQAWYDFVQLQRRLSKRK